MTTPLIEAVDIAKSFAVRPTPFAPRKTLKAVDGVTLQIRPGETLGLAGESGCGKSTVGKILVGLLAPDGGTMRFRGKEMGTASKDEYAAFRKDVQMIFQDPFSSLNPRMRVGEIIGEPLAIHRIVPKEERRKRVLELMGMVGLSAEQINRYPHEFSGGQRQRIGIARALAVSPKLIVADEPVSALDLSIQAQIINLLDELKKTLGLSYLFIAHDLSVIRHLSDRVAVMYLGRIVETGRRDDIFNRFRHPYTEALLSAVPRVATGPQKKRIILSGEPPSPLDPPQGCPFHPRCPYAEPVCTAVRPPLEEKASEHLAACHFSKKLFS